ncbi:MFS transporter [Gordonia sp. DT219]|uniref:MFS transporter n=1 Tax=Gordonia sp. DT219 TaxID=3416658 RepID=UPI003CFB3340
MPSTETTTVGATAYRGHPFSWRFTTPLFIGSALNPINSSLLATALVPIAHGIGVPVGQTATLVAALYLASAIGQPTAGKAAEVFGPRRIFLGGIMLVGIGGIIGGFGNDLVMLLVSRILLGLGTSCAYPTAMLLIRRRANDAGMDQPPGGVLGGLMISGIATASLGLPIGGLLVGVLGWRAVFFVNIPVAAIALVATLLWVEPDRRGRPEEPGRQRASARAIASDLDVIGVAGFVLAMLALLMFLFGLPTTRWWVLAVSVVLWPALGVWELRAAAPFLDLRMLVSNIGLSSAYVRFGLANLCVYVVLYGITQWIESVRGFSESAAGLLLLPMTLVSGLVIAPISRRNLVRLPVIAAAVTCLLGSLGALLLTGTSWIGIVVILTVLFGMATGFATAGNQTALYRAAPAEQLGTASGLLRTFGYLGSIAASAITGIVFHDDVTDSGVHLIGWIMTGVSIALVAITVATLGARSHSH